MNPLFGKKILEDGKISYSEGDGSPFDSVYANMRLGSSLVDPFVPADPLVREAPGGGSNTGDNEDWDAPLVPSKFLERARAFRPKNPEATASSFSDWVYTLSYPVGLQKMHTGEGGTPVSRDQAAVRSCQGALLGSGQEHGAPDDAVCAEQSVDGAQANLEVAGVSAPAARARPCEPGQNGRRRPQSAPENLPNSTSMSTSEIHRLSSHCGGGLQTLPRLSRLSKSNSCDFSGVTASHLAVPQAQRVANHRD